MSFTTSTTGHPPTSSSPPMPDQLRFPLLGRDQDQDAFGYKKEGSLLTVAQAGSGKDRCVITPNLITYQGAVITVDPKGQSVDETAAWRHTKLGHRLHIFDPYGVGNPALIPPGSLATFNPVDLIRTSRTPIEDAKVIAAALVQAEDRQPHFSNGARQLLAGILVFVALDAKVESRTMGQVWRYLRLGSSFETALGPDGPKSKEDYFRTFLATVAQSKVARGYAAGEANAFLRMNSKEGASFLSTLYTNCGAIFDSPAILDSMESSSVNFGDLQRNPASVYLVLPGAFAETHARWFRLLLACAFMQIERAGLAPITGHDKPPATLFILNEFFTLGRFPQIVEAMGRMRGYGVKFWSFVQNLSQLKQNYGDAWTNIAGNAGIIQFFGGSGDVFTMEYMSKLSGLMEAKTTSITESDRGPGSVSYSTMSRPVKYPDEMGRLEAGTQFVHRSGEHPKFAQMVYSDQDFPNYKRHMEGLTTLRFICPSCGKTVAKVNKPDPKASEILVSFPCHGVIAVPHSGPGWRAMRSGEERVAGKPYRSYEAGGDVWDVFDPVEPEAVAEALPEAQTGPLDPIDVVRFSDRPFDDASLEAVLLLPFGRDNARTVALARWVLGGLLSFVALEPRWSEGRTKAALMEKVAWPYDIFRGFMEGVSMSEEAEGLIASVATTYLASDEEEAVDVHRCLQDGLLNPSS